MNTNRTIDDDAIKDLYEIYNLAMRNLPTRRDQELNNNLAKTLRKIGELAIQALNQTKTK